MVGQEEWMDVLSLRKSGHTISAIRRLTGMSRNTIRGVLRSEGPRKYRRKGGTTKLTPFEDYVQRRWEETALSGVRILEEIEAMGYTGSIQTLRRFLARFRGDRRRESRLTVRFETPPGKQAQADWAYCGRFEDAFYRVIPIYAFVTILGYSRMRFVRFTTSMSVPFLIESQLAAFSYFGGAPEWA
jgi:transposase